MRGYAIPTTTWSGLPLIESTRSNQSRPARDPIARPVIDAVEPRGHGHDPEVALREHHDADREAHVREQVGDVARGGARDGVQVLVVPEVDEVASVVQADPDEHRDPRPAEARGVRDPQRDRDHRQDRRDVADPPVPDRVVAGRRAGDEQRGRRVEEDDRRGEELGPELRGRGAQRGDRAAQAVHEAVLRPRCGLQRAARRAREHPAAPRGEGAAGRRRRARRDPRGGSHSHDGSAAPGSGPAGMAPVITQV